MRLALVVGVIALVAGIAHADKPTRIDDVIIGAFVRELGHYSPAMCGLISVVVEQEFRVVRVEQGHLDAQTIVVEVTCPSDRDRLAPGELARLWLLDSGSKCRALDCLSTVPTRRRLVRRQRP